MALNFPSSPTTGQTYQSGNQVWTYNGSSWISGFANSAYVRQAFTATALQTTFAVSGGYQAGLVDVYQNGVKLVNGTDVTVTSGSNVVLTTGATAGDVIEVMGLSSVTGLNYLPLTGGVVSGTVGVGRSVSGGYSLQTASTLGANDGTVEVFMAPVAASSAALIGTVSNHALAVYTNNLERMRVDNAGNVGIGVSAPVERLDIAGSFIMPALSYTGSNLYFNAGWKYKANGYGAFLQLSDGSGVFNLGNAPNNASGAGTAATPVIRLQIDQSGNIINVSSGGLGYGTGSGGTVTQITSKTTGVTLNKTNGYIMTSNAALAAAATATFTVTNSTMVATDVVIVNPTNGNYSARANNNANGSFTISLKNESGGSLSDAVQIQFAIIRAVTA